MSKTYHNTEKLTATEQPLQATPDLDAALRNVQEIADEMPDISTLLPQWTPERIRTLSGLPADEVRVRLRELIADLDELIADKAAER